MVKRCDYRWISTVWCGFSDLRSGEKKNPKISRTSWQEKAIQWKCIRHFNFTSSFLFYFGVSLSLIYFNIFSLRSCQSRIVSERTAATDIDSKFKRMRYIFVKSEESSSNQYTDLLAQVCENAFSINLWQYLLIFLSVPLIKYVTLDE